MKKIIFILAVLLLGGCSLIPSHTDFLLLQATDTHFLADSLYDDGPLFTGIEQGGDGKYISKGTELVDELIHQAKKRGAALLLTGDLTFNGEKISHEVLTAKLHALEKQGTPAYVLPGNHDIRPHAWKLTGSKEQKIEGIDQATFRSMYASFGYDEAYSRDPSSFSYATYLSRDTVLVALDVNTSSSPYTISAETMNWFRGVHEDLASRKLKYITASHQNLFVHNERFTHGFRFGGAEELRLLMAAYPPLVHLSGHLHIQHQNMQEKITEIVTSSMAIYPHHIAQITPEGYRAEPLMAQPFLQDSEAFYRKTVRNKVLERLFESTIPQQEKEPMVELAIDLNTLYFSGHLEKLPALAERPAYSLWQKYPDAGFSAYLRGVFSEPPINHTIKDFYEDTDSNGHRTERP